jgi:xanthine/uracil permease
LIDAWADGKELLTGAAIFVTIIVGYLVARGMHRAHFSAVVDDHVCGAD